ncbi:RNA-binding protein 5-like isoform X2 [Paralichthys olivaceus]|uniref:RNA-binding protein 5-like isoform X2 n=1 Tax=Paralichthys olivaceus TaxID=8255 RepID=UPI00375181C1
MGTDKRLIRGEQSGRYGSDKWKDHMDCHKIRRSRSFFRKRRLSRPNQDYKMEPQEKNTSIFLRGLPPYVTEDENKLVIQGKCISVQYSKKEPMYKNWLCNSCGLCNFWERLRCFKCGTARVDGECPAVNSINVESQQDSDYNGDTLIMRNIAQISTIDGILNILSPYANLSKSKLCLIRDKHTGNHKGFGFVQLSSPLEASQLLTVLQSLQPPLKLDGKIVAVDYAENVRKDGAQPGGVQANVNSVASTAITAAQWSSSQLPPGSDATSDYFPLPEGFSQQSQEQNYQVWQQLQQQQEGSSVVNGDGLPGAAPGTNTLLPAATDVVISQTAQIYQPDVISQHAIQSHHVERVVDAEQQQQQQQPASVCTASLATPAASSVATTVSASPTVNTSAVPDMSTYKYDKASGYYHDPETGLYYDPSSEYYYNPETQQFLYWDGEKQTYVMATADMMAEPSSSSKEPKGKKKSKTKSAQQIAENMERWTKKLNRKKKKSKEENEKWSAAADAGFSLFEKKQTGDIEMPSLRIEQFKIPEQETKSDPFVYYNGNYDPEEGSMYRAADEEGNITDWRNIVCLLCQRQFPTKEALLRHQQHSDLHKQNLEIQRRTRFSVAELGRREAELNYRDRAAERREKSSFYAATGEFCQPPLNYDQPTKDGLTTNNIANKIFPAMGWHEGRGLGYYQQEITAPTSASFRTMGTGMGSQSYELSPYDTYEAHEAMFAGFNGFE